MFTMSRSLLALACSGLVSVLSCSYAIARCWRTCAHGARRHISLDPNFWVAWRKSTLRAPYEPLSVSSGVPVNRLYQSHTGTAKGRLTDGLEGNPRDPPGVVEYYRVYRFDHEVCDALLCAARCPRRGRRRS